MIHDSADFSFRARLHVSLGPSIRELIFVSCLAMAKVTPGAATDVEGGVGLPAAASPPLPNASAVMKACHI